MAAHAEIVKLGTEHFRRVALSDPAHLEKALDKLPNDQIFPAMDLAARLGITGSLSWLSKVIQDKLPRNFVRLGARAFIGSKAAISRAKKEMES